jgi:two-component system, cell cycle sensor histidine kinase and response regulator CckA
MTNVGAKRALRGCDTRHEIHIHSLAQKTELIEKLAGAMANQFNNVMMAITGYAELELKKATPAGKRSLEQVIRNAARATSLVQRLIALSRTHQPAPQPLQINSVIGEIEELLIQLAGDRTEIVLSLDPKVPRISADPIQIEQALMSLAINACEAAKGSKKIFLSTELVEVEKSNLRSNQASGPGQYVMLSFHLPGALAIQKSKASAANHGAGGGNGVLGMIEEIVLEAQGMVRISRETNGTKLMMYFPALSEESSVQASGLPAQCTGATKTVLVVEDDDAVRIPTAEFLMMEGYKALQAKTGPEAIGIAAQRQSPIDLLITDIIMPAMTGHEVARKLSQTHPGLKVLYMSGDASDIPANLSGAPQDDLLQKPFRFETLNERIRSILAQ